MFLPALKSQADEDISILLKVENHSADYICECGDAKELTVKECQDTAAIFLSHTHIDHFINFDFILRHQLGTGKRVIICGPEGINKQVQSKIKGYCWNLIEEGSITYEIRTIQSNGEIMRHELSPPEWELTPLPTLDQKAIYSNKDFSVSCAILDHKTPSIAYLFKKKDTIKINMAKSGLKGGPWVNELKLAFENNEGKTPINIGIPNQKIGESLSIAGEQLKAQDLFHLLEIKPGDSFGVIMDHAAHEENHQRIRKLFTGCRQVFIECFYKAADQSFAHLNHHSFSTASGRIMKECNVQQATPVHFSRKYNEEDIQEIKDEFYKAFEG